jgi:hypothetical protein
MIHGLPNLLAQIAYVYHDTMPLPEIVQSKDLAKSHGPHKKGSPLRSLSVPNTFPGKSTTTKASQGVKE